MNGVHDMGGMHGFGPVVREENEPPFHEPWEGRTYAMRRIAGGNQRLGAGRYAIERLDPAFYLKSSYYERWLEALILVLNETGVVGADELAARVEEYSREPDRPVPEVNDPARAQQVVSRMFRRQEPVRRAVPESPSFKPGDSVSVRNINPKGHTRLPRYLRGKAGVIDRYNGYHDPHDHERGDEPVSPPQPLYSVSFDMTDIWGDEAEPGRIVADLWESYLELPAPGRATP